MFVDSPVWSVVFYARLTQNPFTHLPHFTDPVQAASNGWLISPQRSVHFTFGPIQPALLDRLCECWIGAALMKHSPRSHLHLDFSKTHEPLIFGRGYPKETHNDGIVRILHRSSRFQLMKQNSTNSLSAHNISFTPKTQQRCDTDPSQMRHE
ncbi:hypothetical protein Y032_0555g3369 [Ancylostoma ceylanicum]|uniref:Uncharacterized protein n=1 Tax=Ancylostoma ceylanicum TaxID=53326 RepID=A0A016WR97_9BILA|nr:hypothetical protein Y032_0555g3369 [Ancylostoma ceylanicum]